ncbi:YceI family protein [Conexibacter sp. CPCC 206217]|uniref:YceI family protein n=1 Tax=Conexibacter sp. CPCC 206217 TaxID=3064574 RepID=UPI00271B31ED|nr:YceI family protein [Conexibacter sp. CPCC 206217]MDO8212081.1 YceI family protein [Conexibacter sp. CPCC 206217]
MSSAETVQDRLAGAWRFMPVHSSAGFAIKYLVASFRGRFEEVDAQLVDGRLAGSVKVASVSVRDENLIAHLQAPDFFDAVQHPEISFASDQLAIDGDRVELNGQLTMKGVTKPIHATGTVNGPTEDFAGHTRLGFTLETTVDRTAFGVSWNADLPKGGRALSNDVTLTVELEFVRV